MLVFAASKASTQAQRGRDGITTLGYCYLGGYGPEWRGDRAVTSAAGTGATAWTAQYRIRDDKEQGVGKKEEKQKQRQAYHSARSGGGKSSKAKTKKKVGGRKTK